MAACSAIKNDGERCTRSATRGREFCYMHDPANAEKIRASTSKAGKRGGRGRSNKGKLQDIQHQLQVLADGIKSGEIDTKVGSVSAQIFNVLIRAISTEAELTANVEYEERLAAIEKALEEHTKTPERRVA